MLLYFIYNEKTLSISPPAIADNLESIQSALTTLNPENLADLKIHTITPLNSFNQLFQLTLNPGKALPTFLKKGRDESSRPTQQSEGVSDLV